MTFAEAISTMRASFFALIATIAFEIWRSAIQRSEEEFDDAHLARATELGCQVCQTDAD